MQDLAYLRHLTFGQYLPRQSVVHSLDPRTKILAVAALSLAIITNASYVAAVLLLATVLSLSVLSRIHPRHVVSGLGPLVPYVIAFAAIQVLFFRGGFGPTTEPAVLWQWGPFVMTDAGMRLAIISVSRLIEFWFLTTLLTNTTPMPSLAHGIEGVFRPFSAIGFPGHELALVLTLALRFLPLFALELEDTVKAQLSRGAKWETGRLALIRNSRQVAVLLVPLFADALRRTEELATAMEARCYVGGKGRTHLLTLRFQARDRIALAAACAISFGLVLLRNSFPW